MKTVPVEQAIGLLEGLYTDIDPENLPSNFISLAYNTQWVNKNTVGKRNGFTKLSWLGSGFLDTHDAGNSLKKVKILDYKVFNARGSSQYYHLVLLQDLRPPATDSATGYIYIEIRDIDNELINSGLFSYDDPASGSIRNSNPVQGKFAQILDYVFLADGSTGKVFYLDISLDDNFVWEQLDINSSVKAGYEDNDDLVDVDIHVQKLFITGSKGKVYYSITLSPLDFQNDGAGYITYNASNSLVAKQIISSYLGLLILSSNKGLNTYAADLMSGTVAFDETLPATESRGFDVKNISNDVSFLPRSVVNVDNNLVGLTTSGVTDLLTFTRSGSLNYYGSVDRNLKLEETLSYPIDNFIRSLDFSSNNIYACINSQYRRYYLSAPSVGKTTSSLVYVYDYKYKTDVPRWSIWRLKINGVGGLFTVRNLAYVADLDGELYELESGQTDDTQEFTARIEFAGIGGDSYMYDKKWSSIGALLKLAPGSESKSFNVFVIADEYLEVRNNYDEPINKMELKPVKKFSSTFDPLYYFDITRTFGDQGYGRQVYFMKNDLYRSKSLRLVIEERLDSETGLSAGPWTFKLAYIKGTIDSIAKQD